MLLRFVNLQNVSFEGRISGLIPNSSLTLTLKDSQNFIFSNQSNGNFSFRAYLNTTSGLIITCPIALVANLKIITFDVLAIKIFQKYSIFV